MNNSAFNKTIEQKLIKFIKEYRLIESGDNILISLSGGSDSVFLLNFLFKYKDKYKITLAAFHLNHLLRKESSSDQRFSQQICSQLRLPFFTTNKNVKIYARRNKLSIEEAGRNLRYKCLKEFADKYSFNKIATAHNLDDNAETVLLNLIKGKGLRSISGIPIKHENIIRPIMCLTKSEIEKYLRLNKIDFVEDLSNQSDIYERNYLRLKIVPELLKKFNKNLSNSIFQTSKILEGFLELFDKILIEKYYDLVSLTDGDLILKLNSFYQENKIIQTEIIRRVLLEELKIEPTFKIISDILNLVRLQIGKKISISDEYQVIRERNLLRFTKSNEKKSVHIKVRVGNTYSINNQIISVKKSKKTMLDTNPNNELIDADKIVGNLIIRNWKEGDRFIPLGMKGSKKVSDFLTDAKISVKERVLVLTDDEKILSVIGHRIDDRVKISNDTKNFYKIEIKNGN